MRCLPRTICKVSIKTNETTKWRIVIMQEHRCHYIASSFGVRSVSFNQFKARIGLSGVVFNTPVLA